MTHAQQLAEKEYPDYDPQLGVMSSIAESIYDEKVVSAQRAAFINGYNKRHQWQKVEDSLPECVHIMGVGNKYSDDVLATDGENYYVCNLERVRPEFTTAVWTISVSDEIAEEWSGKPITHWMPLPELPNDQNTIL